MDTKEIHLAVVSPERTVFDGKVTSVTLPGELGSFQVLPGHAPLISSLAAGEMKYTAGKETQVLQIAGGFVEVRDNSVSACVEL